MFRRVIPEQMDSAIQNARKDHPKVRRISPNVFGVTCGRKDRCVRKAEHEIEFEERPNGLWADCRDCESQKWRTGTCRHIAAALPMFFHCRSIGSSPSVGTRKDGPLIGSTQLSKEHRGGIRI